MGNSPNWEEIRAKTIHDRNEKINHYLPIFRGIIKNNNINADQV